MAAQGSQLGSEHDAAMNPTHVQRLITSAVACQQQFAGFAIPESQGEHAIAALQGGFWPPMLERRQQHLRVGIPSPFSVPGSRKLQAQFHVIVDLAIERQDEPARSRAHRLPAGLAEVEHSESAMGKPDAGIRIQPGTFTIRPAVSQRISHHPQHPLGISRQAAQHARYAAHERTSTDWQLCALALLFGRIQQPAARDWLVVRLIAGSWLDELPS
jgi:hypothetical protein